MRVSAKERKENARQWYSTFINGCSHKSAITIIRNDSTTNPNINRTQFMAVPSQLGFAEPVIIAESAIEGTYGCLYELLQNIKKTDSFRSYHENDFNEWLEENYGIYVTYNDGLVMMFEREGE